MRSPGPPRWVGSPRWDEFYPTLIWNVLSDCKKFVALLERDCFDNVAFKREFLDFQYGFQKVAAISFYCIQYYDYNHRFLYSFETSWDISFIVSESKKLAANKFKWNIEW